MTTRFADTGEGLYELATHFVVHCPKCDQKALIKKHNEVWRLTCTDCFHVEEEGKWYGEITASVAVKCRECNAPLRRQASVDGEWKKLKMVCESCGDVCEYEAHFTKHFQKEGWVTDRIFGLKLWLQTEFGDDILWAYHYEHLQMLEDFIGALLRERGIKPRNTYRKNSSMISRLPEFINRAGNRDKLLKVISELQRKEA